MPEFTIDEEIQAPAGQVWPVLADFGGEDMRGAYGGAIRGLRELVEK